MSDTHAAVTDRAAAVLARYPARDPGDLVNILHDIQAEFRTSRSQTRDLLMAGEARLRESLDQAGLQLGRLQIAMDDSTGRHHGQGSGRGAPDGEAPAGNFRRTPSEVQLVERPAPLPMLPTERLDVLV